MKLALKYCEKTYVIHSSAVCGRKVELLNVKPVGT